MSTGVILMGFGVALSIIILTCVVLWAVLRITFDDAPLFYYEKSEGDSDGFDDPLASSY